MQYNAIMGRQLCQDGNGIVRGFQLGTTHSWQMWTVPDHGDPGSVALAPHHHPPLVEAVHRHQVVLAPSHDVL